MKLAVSNNHTHSKVGQECVTDIEKLSEVVGVTEALAPRTIVGETFKDVEAESVSVADLEWELEQECVAENTLVTDTRRVFDDVTLPMLDDDVIDSEAVTVCDDVTD